MQDTAAKVLQHAAANQAEALCCRRSIQSASHLGEQLTRADINSWREHGDFVALPCEMATNLPRTEAAGLLQCIEMREQQDYPKPRKPVLLDQDEILRLIKVSFP